MQELPPQRPSHLLKAQDADQPANLPEDHSSHIEQRLNSMLEETRRKLHTFNDGSEQRVSSIPRKIEQNRSSSSLLTTNFDPTSSQVGSSVPFHERRFDSAMAAEYMRSGY